MNVKEYARCLFYVMKGFGIPAGKAISALIGIYDVSIHDIAVRAGVTDQFVRRCLAGDRTSDKVDEAVKELLFGSGASVDLW
jgi:hypothetical protein